MICVNCKRMYSFGHYCPDCGEQLVSHQCKQCKNNLSYAQKFCEVCGTPNPINQTKGEHPSWTKTQTT